MTNRLIRHLPSRLISRQRWLYCVLRIVTAIALLLLLSVQFVSAQSVSAQFVSAQSVSAQSVSTTSNDLSAVQNNSSVSSPAQTTQSEPAATSPTAAVQSDGSGINRLVPEQLLVETSTIDATPIYLDGRIIFKIAVPTLSQQPMAEERAQVIQQRINDVKRQLSSEAPAIAVSIDSASNLPVIVADGKLLTTVTYQDAQLHGYASPNSLAIALAEDLRMAFDRYLQERSPAFLRDRAQFAIGIFITALFIQLGIRRLVSRLRRRQARLVSAKTQLGKNRRSYPSIEIPYVPGFNSVFDQVKARLDNRQKRKLNETAWGLLLLFQPLLWVGSLLWILSLFPYSRWLTTLSLHWLKIPAQIFLLSGLAYVVIRLSSLLIDKTSLAFQSGNRWSPDRSQRLNLRFVTLSQVVKSIVGLLVLAVTMLLMLSTAGVQIAPLLAGAGIVGIGISLAAQSLIKDLITGFFILFEDQFGVGDIVTIEGLTGTVEYVNLRITQLRDTEGKLITIPNSQINIVQNLSMDWAQVDLSVTVSPHSDLKQVSELLKAIATNLSKDEQWQRFILEPPDLLGVEALDYTGTTMRLFLKTQPLEQWRVARELRRRIKEAFDRAGIHIGIAKEHVSIQWEEETELQREEATELQQPDA